MKILVVHASAGAGHRVAAEAVYEGLKSRASPDDHIVLIDALTYSSFIYKFLYSRTYTFLITRIPWLWGLLFRWLDTPALLPFIRFARRFQNAVHARPLENYLKDEKFDVIVSTHFFPNEVASSLRRKGVINSKIVCVVTDYDVHSIWLAEGIDHYAAACDFTRTKLNQLGVTDEKILVSGIPTLEKFSRPKDVLALKEKLRLKDNVFTILIATGSFGIGPIEKMIEIASSYQVMVVCGHNLDLFHRLSQNRNEQVKVYGLVRNMDELMAAADVMITKPGGLSISEALVSGLPLIFFNAIPGQEENNVKVLKQYGIGIELGIKNLEEARRFLAEYSGSPEIYQKLQTKIGMLAKPSAVKDIITLVKKELPQPPL